MTHQALVNLLLADVNEAAIKDGDERELEFLSFEGDAEIEGLKVVSPCMVQDQHGHTELLYVVVELAGGGAWIQDANSRLHTGRTVNYS